MLDAAQVQAQPAQAGATASCSDLEHQIPPVLLILGPILQAAETVAAPWGPTAPSGTQVALQDLKPPRSSCNPLAVLSWQM